MSDNKKYYYLKLKENFFESDSMIVLEGMPDGYLYSNILLKLYLRSLHGEGRLMFNNKIPFDNRMLSRVTGHDEKIVKEAMRAFTDLGLVEIMDSGAIYMLDIQNFIGKSSDEADRKRVYRARIDNERKGLGQMSGQTSDKNPPEIESESESEKEKEKEIESESEKESDTDTSDTDNNVSSSSQYSLRDLLKCYEDNVLGHKSSNSEQASFIMLYDQYGDNQLRDAITAAALNNAGGINYIKTVLSNGTNYSPEKWRAEHG